MRNILVFLASVVSAYVALQYFDPSEFSFREASPYLAIFSAIVALYCVSIGKLSLGRSMVFRSKEPVEFWFWIGVLVFLASYLALYPQLPWAKP
jgi:hypothetical protein